MDAIPHAPVARRDAFRLARPLFSPMAVQELPFIDGVSSRLRNSGENQWMSGSRR
jgi:hypothetical protein